MELQIIDYDNLSKTHKTKIYNYIINIIDKDRLDMGLFTLNDSELSELQKENIVIDYMSRYYFILKTFDFIYLLKKTGVKLTNINNRS